MTLYFLLDADFWTALREYWPIASAIIVGAAGLIYRIAGFEKQMATDTASLHKDVSGLRDGLEKLSVLPERVKLLEQRSDFGQAQREDHQKILDKLSTLIELHCLNTAIHVNPTHDNQKHDAQLAQWARFEQLILELTEKVAMIAGEVKQAREHRR